MQSNKAWDTKGCGYTLINHPFPSLSPPLSLSLRLVILYYIKLIICAARLYILFYQLALDRPAIRSVFSNARYQRGKIGLRPGKKVASFTACLRRAPLDLTKTHSARMWNVPKWKIPVYFATVPYVTMGIKALFITRYYNWILNSLLSVVFTIFS